MVFIVFVASDWMSNCGEVVAAGKNSSQTKVRVAASFVNEGNKLVFHGPVSTHSMLESIQVFTVVVKGAIDIPLYVGPQTLNDMCPGVPWLTRRASITEAKTVQV